MGPAQVVARPGRVREAEWPKDHHPVRNFPSCVHLDAGVDGNWSGHLLHLPPAQRSHPRVRHPRLGRPRADGRDRPSLAHDELPLVARIPIGRRGAPDRHIGGCFAAGADVLVASSSPAPGKAGASLRGRRRGCSLAAARRPTTAAAATRRRRRRRRRRRGEGEGGGGGEEEEADRHEGRRDEDEAGRLGPHWVSVSSMRIL